MFSPSGSHTILVSQHQTSWQYSNQNPLTVASNAGGVGINRDCSRIAVYRSMTVARANNKCDNPRYSLSHRRGRISESMFITACSMHDHNETKKKNKFYFYAAVNLKRNLRSTYCTIEATDRHEAWLVCVF